MLGGYGAYVSKHLASCGSYNVHHVLGIAPLLTLANDLLEKTLAFRVGGELEVIAALVAGEGEQDNPLAFVLQEWLHGILAHVWSHGERIEVVLLEEGLGVHLGGVADVTTLGICDDEVVRIVSLQILDGVLEGDHTLYTTALVESQVRLVCHTVRGCGIDDSLVESEHQLRLCTLDFLTLDDALRQLVNICIETYAQEALLGEDLLY